MRSLTTDNITDAFLGYFGEDTDPRIAEIMAILKKTSLYYYEHYHAKDQCRFIGSASYRTFRIGFHAVLTRSMVDFKYLVGCLSSTLIFPSESRGVP